MGLHLSLFHYFWLSDSCSASATDCPSGISVGNISIPNPPLEYWSDENWCEGASNCNGRQKAPMCSSGSSSSDPSPIDWTTYISIFNQLRPHTIGYDNIFDHFNDMFEGSGLQTNYPPYDIIKHSDTKYDVHVALAGYSKEDIDVEVKENTLSIKSIKNKEDKDIEILHRGIATRHFERHFTIADDVALILSKSSSVSTRTQEENCLCGVRTPAITGVGRLISKLLIAS